MWSLLFSLACSAPDSALGDVHGDAASPPPEETTPSVEEIERIAGETTGPDDVFSETAVLSFAIELEDAALEALATAPTSYVRGTFLEGDVRYEDVGVRLKGNSTYQWLDGKPAWKVKFDEYLPGGRFHGLERVTLDSNYWDGSQMAETLAYRLWRRADNPAPRTGYATVVFNGEPYGLYTIVEAMDDDFVEAWWPGSAGGLYEMGRTCDFNADCSCYELQDTGERFDPDGLTRACAAAASGDLEAIKATWDWERFVRYQALERVANHPDSYTFNLNNYYVYHDPLTDKVTLTPWGADSTFSYAYPPDAEQPCQPGLFDDLSASPYGWMGRWCVDNAACWDDVKAEMSALADLLEAEDYAGEVALTAARIDTFVEEEPRWPWGYDTFTKQVDCFQTWIADRPEQVRAFVESH